MSQSALEKSVWRWCGTIGNLAGLVCALAACGGANESEPRAIRIEPSDAMVSIVNGAAVDRTYTATLIDSSGGERDVTGEVTFSLRDARYGRVQDATITVTGQGAGPTRVIARYGELTGETGLTVFIKDTIVDPDIDPATPERFATAAEDASLAPAIVYPPEGSVLPPNLGPFDVHWTQSIANVFEIKLSNTYVDIRRYTKGDDLNQHYWTVFGLAQWYLIASARERVAIDVAGMNIADPTKQGLSLTTEVAVTNQDARGGVYYWTSSAPAGIWRYDLSKNTPTVPGVPSAPYFTPNELPANGCMGCHVLSRDGTKIAMTFEEAQPGGLVFRSTVFDVASHTALIPFDGVTQPALHWTFATFNAPGTKLVTVEGSQLYLRALNGALLTGPLRTVVAGNMATHPDFSPDNKRLVNVEFTSGLSWQANGGSIVVRDYDDATNTFNPPTVLVQPVGSGTNAYPSFSPDGKWIVFTRTASSAYDDSSAEIWVVKADGSQQPVPLTKANFQAGYTNSWARWVPYQQTSGPSDENLFYLAFSSRRGFGVRIPNGVRPQIWVAPFFPDRAEAGFDPSGAADWLPFQDPNTNNHIAQWIETVVGP